MGKIKIGKMKERKIDNRGEKEKERKWERKTVGGQEWESMCVEGTSKAALRLKRLIERRLTLHDAFLDLFYPFLLLCSCSVFLPGFWQSMQSGFNLSNHPILRQQF